MWQKLKPKNQNIVTNHISKPIIAIVVETHLELDMIVIKLDNQMVVIQVQVGKNIVEGVLIDGKASVNIIT